MMGQCMRCKAQREMQNHVIVQMKNGKTAFRGQCGDCGAKIFRIAKGP